MRLPEMLLILVGLALITYVSMHSFVEEQEHINDRETSGSISEKRSRLIAARVKAREALAPTQRSKKMLAHSSAVQSPSSPPPHLTSPRMSCRAADFQPDTELDGAVVRSGQGDGGHAATAVACCQLCLALRACNVWVFSAQSGACWLKHTDTPKSPSSRARGPSVPWTSGTLLKAYWDSQLPLPRADPEVRVVALRTSQGDIRLRLRDDWHSPSADSIRRLTSPELATDSCSQCEFYRPEYGFLLQGVLRGVLPPNRATGCSPAPQCQPGPRVMVRGDVGWAGGGAGPDFFIYLGKHPASWLKRDHTVWAEVRTPPSSG